MYTHFNYMFYYSHVIIIVMIMTVWTAVLQHLVNVCLVLIIKA